MEAKIWKKDLIAQRGYHPDDRNFILCTWLRSLYEDNKFYKKIKKASYFEHYDEIIKEILDNPTTIVSVACLEEDPDVVLGYAIFKNTSTLHYVFVKDHWRGIGIMRDLLKPFRIKTVTHLTETGEKIKPKRISFDPFEI